MSDQLLMFDPETLPVTPNAISSLESEPGATLSASPNGQMIGPSGPPPVRANRSRRQASAKARQTSGTFGPNCFDSCESAALSLRLANRLRAATASLGSTLFELTWKNAYTPAGAWCPRLAATARPIAVSDFIGAPWHSPRATDGSNGGPNQGNGALPPDAALCGWPTAAARDWKSGQASEETLEHNARPLSEIAVLAGWPTAQARDWKGAQGRAYKGEAVDMSAVAHLAAWSTATVNDSRAGCNATANRSPEAKPAESGWTLVDLARLTCFPGLFAAHGPERIGFCVGPSGWEIRPASGQLNPGLSRWLMGLPPEFCDSAVTAMQSLPRRPRRSLKP